MIFGKSANEFKVGVFVFFGIIILFLFVMFIGDIKNMVSAYPLDITFTFINGIKVGAPVRYAGVDIGEVQSTSLFESDGKTRVVVKCLIHREIRIPVNSQVWINTLGILGEKYLEIMPGSSTEVYKAGATVCGNDPVAMQEFGEIAKSVATKLDSRLDDFKKLSDSLTALTVNLDDALTRIKNGEGSLGKLIYRDDLYNELNAFVVDVRQHPWKLFFKGK
ncbi:MAG: MlaD family protein [Deltaproteobacteria bacterium]